MTQTGFIPNSVLTYLPSRRSAPLTMMHQTSRCETTFELLSRPAILCGRSIRTREDASLSLSLDVSINLGSKRRQWLEARTKQGSVQSHPREHHHQAKGSNLLPRSQSQSHMSLLHRLTSTNDAQTLRQKTEQKQWTMLLLNIGSPDGQSMTTRCTPLSDLPMRSVSIASDKCSYSPPSCCIITGAEIGMLTGVSPSNCYL